MKKSILLMAAMVALSVLPAKAWENMYVIGNATGSWDLANAKQMNKISECEFELTLYLHCTSDNDGFKFLTDKTRWEHVYAPNSDNRLIERNWKIEDLSYNDAPSSHNFGVKKDGWYTLHINTAVEYIDEKSGETKTKVVLSTWPMEIYPVGGGCKVGWPSDVNVKTITDSLKETSFGSGIYQGSLELKVSGATEGDHQIKFLTQKDWGPHFGPANPTSGNWDISGYGVFGTKFYTESDQKFYVLDDAVGKYNMTLDAKTGKLYIVPQEISIKAQIEMGALEEMETVNCHVWTELVPGEAKDIVDIVPTEDGWFEAKVTGVYGPINFLYKGNKWNVQTPDMKNDENGYYTDKSCTIYAEKQDDGKLKCFHNDKNTVLNQTITLEFKLAEGTTWSDKEGRSDMYLREWQNILTDGTAGDRTTYQKAEVADCIYSFSIPVVNQVKFVLQTVGEGWNPLTVETSTYKNQKYWISKENEGYKLIATDSFDKGPTTSVEQTSVVNDNIVYDIMGRALGTSVENLPQGIYVRNGKKFVVAQ